MTTWYIISFTLLLIIGIAFMTNGLLQLDTKVGIFNSVFGAALILYVMVFMYFAKPVPSAMDVYRGNTTLQITYQDSIPLDSIVVFKENK